MRFRVAGYAVLVVLMDPMDPRDARVLQRYRISVIVRDSSSPLTIKLTTIRGGCNVNFPKVLGNKWPRSCSCNWGITEAPDRAYENRTFESTDSVAIVAVYLSIEAMEAAVNDAVPVVLAPIDQNVHDNGCVIKNPWTGSCIFDWSASVHASGSVWRTDAPRISVTEGNLTITQGIAATATLTPRGDFGR